MEEKKHVGRPTNEEVASRKKKKVVKYSLITIVSILLVGGIALFLNRDNIDFSSLLGNSASKTITYSDDSHGGDSLFNYHLNLKEIKSCTVSKKKYLSCVVDNSEYSSKIILSAKKSGTVTIKVKGIDSNGKTKSVYKKIKIPKDFKSPTCRISTPSKVVSPGSKVTLTISCNENVSLSSVTAGNLLRYMNVYYKSIIQGRCFSEDIHGSVKDFDEYNNYLTSYKKLNNKSYQVSLKIPSNACITNELIILVDNAALVDGSGNLNYEFKTSIRIVK